MKRILHQNIPPAAIKYTRGKQTCTLCHNYRKFLVYNLEDLGCPDAGELQNLSPPSLLLSSNNTSDDDDRHASVVVFNTKRLGGCGGCPPFLDLERHDRACAAINTNIYLRWVAIKSREDPNERRFKHPMVTTLAFL